MWIDKSINLSVCDDIDCEQSLIFYGDSGLSCVSLVNASGERQSPRDTKNQAASLLRGANTLALKNKRLFTVYFRKAQGLFQRLANEGQMGPLL